MTPIFTTIDNNLKVIIIPDTSTFNTQPISTYTYYIYEDNIIIDEQGRRAKGILPLIIDKNDPEYIGDIIFQKSGRIYTYHAGGNFKLSYLQINQIIEKITAYSDQPACSKFNF